MCKKRNFVAAAIAAGWLMAAVAPSVAAPVTFTWNPAGASPALGGGEFTADTLSTTGFLTDVGQLDGSGVTHQISVVNGFRLGGAQVTPSGFGTSYGLYLEFFDTHRFFPPPVGLQLLTQTVALRADPGNRNGAASATTAGTGFVNTGATGQADDITLATGSLVSSSSSLDPVTGILDARSVLTFVPSSGQAAFFSAGSGLLEFFSSNPAIFDTTPQPDGTRITTFSNISSTAQLVPEPTSIMLLLIGLLGLLPSMRRKV